MALSDMKVFNGYVREAAIETLAQMVDKFNGASGGALQLSTQGFDGDYMMRSSFSSLHSAQRRVDRYATNTAASSTALAQIQHNTVKVAGGFGPIVWEPAQLKWVGDNPAAAVEVISRNMAEAIMKDMLNTAIAAAVAAIENVGSTAYFDTGTGPITYNDINSAHAKFGDMSQLLICDIMDGTAYHALVGANLTNTPQLFQAGNVTVVEILGKRVVVTDAPALRETGTGADQKVLSLVSGGVVVHDAGDLITNIETNNGAQRIQTTMQADYTFGVGLKGYAWDVTSGGKSPTDAELATGSNWDKVATSLKHTAGVLTIANI